MKKTGFVLPLFALILLAGCAAGGGKKAAVTGDGVVISSFSADYSQLFPEDRTLITMIVENQGDQRATRIVAQLYNYGNLRVDDANILLGSDLEPTDSDQINWDIDAPGEEEVKIIQNYSPAAKLCYSYKTVVYQDFLLTGDDWRGESPILESGISSGPLSAIIDVRSPIRGERKKQSFRFDVEKKGDGFLASGVDLDINENNIMEYGDSGYLASVLVQIPKMDYCGGNCVDINIIEGKSGDFECSDDYCPEGVFGYHCCRVSDKDDLRLIGGESGLFRLYINTKDAGGSLEYTGRVNAEFEYKYCLDTRTGFPLSISVMPIT